MAPGTFELKVPTRRVLPPPPENHASRRFIAGWIAMGAVIMLVGYPLHLHSWVAWVVCFSLAAGLSTICGMYVHRQRGIRIAAQDASDQADANNKYVLDMDAFARQLVELTSSEISAERDAACRLLDWLTTSPGENLAFVEALEKTLPQPKYEETLKQAKAEIGEADQYNRLEHALTPLVAQVSEAGKDATQLQGSALIECWTQEFGALRRILVIMTGTDASLLRPLAVMTADNRQKLHLLSGVLPVEWVRPRIALLQAHIAQGYQKEITQAITDCRDEDARQLLGRLSDFINRAANDYPDWTAEWRGILNDAIIRDYHFGGKYLTGYGPVTDEVMEMLLNSARRSVDAKRTVEDRELIIKTWLLVEGNPELHRRLAATYPGGIAWLKLAAKTAWAFSPSGTNPTPSP